MSNESELRQRWGDVYRSSDEYQGALKADALAQAQLEEQGRQEIQRALQIGDSWRASQIQQKLNDAKLHGNIHERELDRFQANRVGDYIENARQAGQRKVIAMRTGSSEGERPEYYDSQINPDFSTHFPYARPVRDAIGDYKFIGSRGRTGGAQGDDATAAQLTPDELAAAKQAERDAQNRRIADVRKEQYLVQALPPELAKVYQSSFQSEGSATPEERADFLSMPPERQWAKLRQIQGDNQLSKTRSAPSMSGTITSGGFQPQAGVLDYLTNPGVGGPTEFPTVRPVTNGRPTAALNTDALPNNPMNPRPASAVNFGRFPTPQG